MPENEFELVNNLPFYVVEVPVSGEASVNTYLTYEELVARLITLKRSAECLQVFVFRGDRWRLSKCGGFVIDGNGSALRLTDVTPVEPDDTGFMTRTTDH